MIKTILAKIYYKIFPARKEVKECRREIETLKKQVEFFKKHCDISTLKCTTGVLRDIQLENLKYMTELTELFEREIGIVPFIEGGALLGYIRHNGHFIPWDDDIDASLFRPDFEKLVEYAKKHFIWVDVSYIQENSYAEFDKIIRQHPNEYIAIQTPYCLHIYNGTDVKTALNAEFFPWDYIKNDVSDQQVRDFAVEYKKKITELHTWDKIFDYLRNPDLFDGIYTHSESEYVGPGVGHWDMAKLTIRGKHKVSDILPLKKVLFEGVEINIPCHPEKYLELVYGDYMGYPSDVGISHNLEEMNNTVSN